jgi:DNA-directed RNA polymerase specialized sigma24 family protein
MANRRVVAYHPCDGRIGYCRRRGLADHDAHDVAQEVFARLLEALPPFEWDRGRGRFRTWLWQAAVSAMTDPARADYRRDAAERAWREQRIEPNDQQIWRRLFQRRLPSKNPHVVVVEVENVPRPIAKVA